MSILHTVLGPNLGEAGWVAEHSLPDVEELPTAETDTTKVLSPDGTGGVAFVAGAGGLALVVSDTDPGVAANTAWLRTDSGISGGAGTYRQLYLPNATNDAWIEVGLVHYDASNNRRMAVTTSDVATDITLWDGTGATTALVTLGPSKIGFHTPSGYLDFDLGGASGGSAGHMKLISADTGGPAGVGTLFVADAGGFTGSAQFQFAYGAFVPTSDPSFDLGVGTLYIESDNITGELWLQLSSGPAVWGRIGTSTDYDPAGAAAAAQAAAATDATTKANAAQAASWPATTAFDSTVPAAVGTAATGTAAKAAHRDHVHPTGAGTPTTAASGDAAATGSGPAAANTDHRHGMPTILSQAQTLARGFLGT